jgi:hypothetical protein
MGSMGPCGIPILAAMLFATTPVRASEDAAAPSPAAYTGRALGERAPEPTSLRWYGWQTFIVDAASAGVLVASAKANNVPGLLAGTVGYFAGAPFVRTLHDDGGGLSLVRRLAFPFAGGLLGLGVGVLVDAGSNHHDCSEGCAAVALFGIGMGVGAAGAMAYDWFTARDRPPTEPAMAEVWTPMLVATSRMRGVAFTLRF